MIDRMKVRSTVAAIEPSGDDEGIEVRVVYSAHHGTCSTTDVLSYLK